ncbi:MAG: caspase family protein [Propylenella sp.]
MSRTLRSPAIRILWVAVVALLVQFAPLLTGAATAAEPRTALVIGNGAYTYGTLANAVNDASDTAAALREVGFEVTLITDADQRAMDEAVGAFADALRSRGGVGLFYFSGHGVQVEDQNYALPIGDELTHERDVKYKAVNIGQVIEEIGATGNSLNIVVIDACRNNPLKSEGRGGTRGLARVDGGPGLFISFSTSPGAVALDGDGRNSPFTAHFVQAIHIPGISLEQAFKETLKGTYTETGGEQMPWVSSTFFGDFVFNQSGAPPPALTAKVDAPPKPIAHGGGEKVEVAARAAGFLPVAGVYRATGRNPDGSTYQGMTSIVITGGVYRLTWWIGSDVFQGVGRLGGRLLIVDWGSNAPVIYSPRADGVLDGEWADGTATETLEPFALAAFGAARDVAGNYRVEGRNPDGSSYSGAVTIKRAQAGFHLFWNVGSQAYEGSGSLDGNLLTVEWGDATPVVYAVTDDGRLAGLWGGGKGGEVLLPRP